MVFATWQHNVVPRTFCRPSSLAKLEQSHDHPCHQRAVPVEGTRVRKSPSASFVIAGAITAYLDQSMRMPPHTAAVG